MWGNKMPAKDKKTKIKGAAIVVVTVVFVFIGVFSSQLFPKNNTGNTTTIETSEILQPTVAFYDLDTHIYDSLIEVALHSSLIIQGKITNQYISGDYAFSAIRISQDYYGGGSPGSSILVVQPLDGYRLVRQNSDGAVKYILFLTFLKENQYCITGQIQGRIIARGTFRMNCFL
jgi:uncharacterized membrane protein